MSLLALIAAAAVAVELGGVTIALTVERRLVTALAPLAALAGSSDLARLAHHAEAAGDGEAVLRYAPAAAERAAEPSAQKEDA